MVHRRSTQIMTTPRPPASTHRSSPDRLGSRSVARAVESENRIASQRPSVVRQAFEEIDVLEVLGPAAGSLHRDQVSTSSNRHRDIPEIDLMCAFAPQGEFAERRRKILGQALTTVSLDGNPANDHVGDGMSCERKKDLARIEQRGVHDRRDVAFTRPARNSDASRFQANASSNRSDIGRRSAAATAPGRSRETPVAGCSERVGSMAAP
jgi:hypothetical protein